MVESLKLFEWSWRGTRGEPKWLRDENTKPKDRHSFVANLKVIENIKYELQSATSVQALASFQRL